MKITSLAMGFALANVVAFSTANAQGVRQPTTPVAYDYGYYAPTEAAAPSPSDKAVPPAPAAPAAPAPEAAAAPACEACQAECCEHKHECHLFSCCELDCCKGPDPWKLFDCCCLKCHGMEAGGWIDAGFAPNNYGDPWNGPVVMTDRDDGQVNQIYFFLKKEIDYKENCGWAFGGRIDFVYGTDARYVEALGFETHQDGSNKWNGERFYHMAMPQLYAEAAYDDLSFKLGRFYGTAGYEVFTAPDNFFYTHTYMVVYAEPFTQTGLMVSKPLNDEWKIYAGFNRGWDKWEDDNDTLSFQGAISWTGKQDSLFWTILSGDEIAPVTLQNGNRTLSSLVYTWKMDTRTSLILQNDLGWQANGVSDGSTATWYGVAGWLTYQVCCDWTAGFRFEWFQDTDGTRVAALGDSQTQPVNSNVAGSGGFAGNFYDYAIGMNYKPVCNPNLIVRPELRWDNYNGVGHPFDNGTKDDQFMFAIDAIIKY